jgi:magnesium transporter
VDEKREILAEIHETVAKKDWRSVKALVADLLPADVLVLITQLDTTDRVVVFRLLHKRVAAEVFTDLPPDQQAELLELFTEKQTAEIFEEMDPDDRAEVLEEFPAGAVKDLLRIISPAERQMTAALLGYPENSAGRMMTPEFMELRPAMTANEAIEHIRRVGLNKEIIYICYVISPHRKLKGTISLREILFAHPEARIEDLMTPDPVRVSTHDDQEGAASLALKYDLLAVPVVDAESRLVGIITVDDLMDVIEEEASEDAYRMAGMEELSESYFNTRTITLFQRRVVWLVLLMVAQTISGGILKFHQSALTAVVALVFFLPMLAGSAGNTATQSAVLVIRGLAVGEIDLRSIWRVISRESLMGILLGCLLGAVGGGIAWLMGGDPRLFIAVSIAFTITIFVANLVGVILPMVFKRLGFDPAVTSGPAITTVLDMTSLTIYFAVAQIVFNLSA